MRRRIIPRAHRQAQIRRRRRLYKKLQAVTRSIYVRRFAEHFAAPTSISVALTRPE